MTSSTTPQMERTERTSGTVTEIVWTAREGDTVAAFAVQHNTAAITGLFTKPIAAWSARHLGTHRPDPSGLFAPCRVIGGPCSCSTSGAVDTAKLLFRWREAEQDDEVIADALAGLLASETEAAAGKDDFEAYQQRVIADLPPKKFIEFPA